MDSRKTYTEEFKPPKGHPAVRLAAERGNVAETARHPQRGYPGIADNLLYRWTKRQKTVKDGETAFPVHKCVNGSGQCPRRGAGPPEKGTGPRSEGERDSKKVYGPPAGVKYPLLGNDLNREKRLR